MVAMRRRPASTLHYLLTATSASFLRTILIGLHHCETETHLFRDCASSVTERERRQWSIPKRVRRSGCVPGNARGRRSVPGSKWRQPRWRRRKRCNPLGVLEPRQGIRFRVDRREAKGACARAAEAQRPAQWKARNPAATLRKLGRSRYAWDRACRRHLSDGRMLHQHALDLERADAIAGRGNDVVGAPGVKIHVTDGPRVKCGSVCSQLSGLGIVCLASLPVLVLARTITGPNANARPYRLRFVDSVIMSVVSRGSDPPPGFQIQAPAEIAVQPVDQNTRHEGECEHTFEQGNDGGIISPDP